MEYRGIKWQSELNIIWMIMTDNIYNDGYHIEDIWHFLLINPCVCDNIKHH